MSKKFTSIHPIGKNWYLFDDVNAKLLNYNKASKINYKSSFNVRAFYICTPEFDWHCYLYERSNAKVDALVLLQELTPCSDYHQTTKNFQKWPFSLCFADSNKASNKPFLLFLIFSTLVLGIKVLVLGKSLTQSMSTISSMKMFTTLLLGK